MELPSTPIESINQLNVYQDARVLADILEELVSVNDIILKKDDDQLLDITDLGQDDGDCHGAHQEEPHSVTWLLSKGEIIWIRILSVALFSKAKVLDSKSVNHPPK